MINYALCHRPFAYLSPFVPAFRTVHKSNLFRLSFSGKCQMKKSVPSWFGIFWCMIEKLIRNLHSSASTCNLPPSPVAPSVRPTSQLLGAPLGSDVQLECTVEASPMPVSYWLKGGRVLPNSFAGAVNGNYEQPGLSRPEMLLDG